jgi:hypothetical protein
MGVGVAGMIMKLVSQWIIPENSLRLAPVWNCHGKMMMISDWDFV